jgi:S1-C subfamily serine protease
VTLRRLPRPAAAAALVAAAMALAACGGSGGGNGGGAGGNGGAASGSGGDQGAANASAPTTTLPRVAVEAAAPGFDPQRIYAKASPGVVTIRSFFSGSSTTSLFGGGASAAQGSGFVIDRNGEIATNAHVVTDAEAGGTSGPIHEAKQVYVQFPDQNQVPARIVGFDPDADVALLRIDPGGLDLQPLQLATDEKVQVGQPVAAIGSPFGEDNSLSVGIVSATDRTIDSLTNFKIEGAVQTDASINPGNSGGPLLDANGRVIGIDQQINTTSGGNEGVGFAVPIALVSHSLDQLRAKGHVSYAYLGVRTEQLYPQLADELGVPTQNGAMITRVVAGGPAAAAGLHSSNSTVHFQGSDFQAGGDVIVAVNGDPITRASDLPILISRLDPGDTATLSIIRDGHRMNVDVKLGTRPETSGG